MSSGTIVGAAQEERFTRIKHDASFPINAIKFCLNYAGLQPDEIDFVVFYEKPFLKFERLLETYLEFAPRGFGSFASSMPLWIKDKLFQKRNIIKQLEESICAQVNWSKKLLFSDHHLSHCASAFFPSPFERAAIITMDGVGEWATTSYGVGLRNNVELSKSINFLTTWSTLFSFYIFYRI